MEDPSSIAAEIERLQARRKELLEDLAWREPDVQAELEKVKQWIDSGDPELIAAAITYKPTIDVLTSILEDRKRELEEVEARLKELSEKLKNAHITAGE